MSQLQIIISVEVKVYISLDTPMYKKHTHTYLQSIILMWCCSQLLKVIVLPPVENSENCTEVRENIHSQITRKKSYLIRLIFTQNTLVI